MAKNKTQGCKWQKWDKHSDENGNLLFHFQTLLVILFLYNKRVRWKLMCQAVRHSSVTWLILHPLFHVSVIHATFMDFLSLFLSTSPFFKTIITFITSKFFFFFFFFFFFLILP
ncbi:hypothetical protein HanIR_Chr01g0020261 [Helianthus annuus]|nr:hypothetical protein HanIR_Chr01g0020261 [Helianthus annuus]